MAAVHDRLDRQIAIAPLRARVQERGPLPEDKLIRRALANEIQASVSGLGDEIRNCWREIRALRRDYEELREWLEKLEKSA